MKLRFVAILVFLSCLSISLFVFPITLSQLLHFLIFFKSGLFFFVETGSSSFNSIFSNNNFVSWHHLTGFYKNNNFLYSVEYSSSNKSSLPNYVVELYFFLLSILDSVWYCLVYYLEFMQISGIAFVIITCLKCLFVFLLIVLVRVTTPKFKMETITKLGWLYSLITLFVFFLFYWLGFILF